MRRAPIAAIAMTAAIAALGVSHAAPDPPKLAFPLACQIGRTCEVQNYVDRAPGPAALDYHCGHRTYQGHNGVDIRLLDMAQQRAGVAVLAAAAGRVTRLRDGVQDISIRAPGAPPVAGQECGNGVVIDHGDGWETQYCHLARGSIQVKAGDTVATGQPIGRVGLSGDTEFPHLHLTVRHGGQAVDPFAPTAVAAPACVAQGQLWTSEAAGQLGYKRGTILNAGFAAAAATPDAIEAHAVAEPTAASPAIVVYARAIGLEAADRVEIELLAPDGRSLASAKGPPLDHDKAQWTVNVGRKAPPGGWPHGVYRGEIRVRRAGAIAVSRRWEATL